jgi:hypothetical protein
MLQRDLQLSLRARALATHDEVARLTRPLDPEQLNRRPLDGGWSVGQVLEHLCVSTEAYMPPMQAMLRSARADAGAPLREWKPKVFGRLLVNSLTAPRKLSSPRGMVPGATPRGGVREAFLGMHAALGARIDDAASLDWNVLGMSSPVVPRMLRPLARLNLGDVFSVLVVHAERHSRQIERILATLS